MFRNSLHEDLRTVLSCRAGPDAVHAMFRAARCWLGFGRLKRGASVAGHYCIYYIEYCVGSVDVAAGASPGQNTRAGFIDVVIFYRVVVARGLATIIQVNACLSAAIHHVPVPPEPGRFLAEYHPTIRHSFPYDSGQSLVGQIP
jgi:hypothetical protein